MTHTVRVSDSGFVDEATPGRPEPPQPPGLDAGRRRRRPTAVGIAFAVLVVGLLAFGAVAWAGRLHADDVAAYEALADEIDVMGRSLPSLGHGEIPPCRDTDGGHVTRTYPPSTGPQAAEIVGYLVQNGWRQGDATRPAVAHLTRESNGRELTVDLVAPSLSSLVESLTAQSPASAIGCLGR